MFDQVVQLQMVMPLILELPHLVVGKNRLQELLKNLFFVFSYFLEPSSLFLFLQKLISRSLLVFIGSINKDDKFISVNLLILCLKLRPINFIIKQYTIHLNSDSGISLGSRYSSLFCHFIIEAISCLIVFKNELASDLALSLLFTKYKFLNFFYYDDAFYYSHFILSYSKNPTHVENYFGFI